jgi:hypothetical protein
MRHLLQTIAAWAERQRREWLEAIQSVDAGGDCNDRRAK